MTGAERVVFALGALEETGQTALLPQRLHAFVAPGEQLVRIRLMPHVPHELVGGRVEDRMQGNRQLHHPKAGADMPTRARADIDQTITNVLGQRAEFVTRKRANIGGRIDAFENRHENVWCSVIRTGALR